MPALMRNINQIARGARQFRQQNLSEFGITGFQYSYILNICRTPGISQEQLSQAICVNKSNVTRQLALLEESGFILRRQSENDKRIISVYPTNKALAIYPKLKEVLSKWSHYVTQDLSCDEQEQLFLLLEKMRTRALEYVQTNLIPQGEENA